MFLRTGPALQMGMWVSVVHGGNKRPVNISAPPTCQAASQFSCRSCFPLQRDLNYVSIQREKRSASCFRIILRWSQQLWLVKGLHKKRGFGVSRVTFGSSVLVRLHSDVFDMMSLSRYPEVEEVFSPSLNYYYCYYYHSCENTPLEVQVPH